MKPEDGGGIKGRLWALNQLTVDQKKEFRRREYLTYTRRNKASAPPSQCDTPIPSEKKVSTPLPPPLHELLPKPTSTDEIQLNIDVAAMFRKMNMTVPVTEMCKILSVNREILKIIQVLTEKEDPLTILNTMYLDRQRDKNPPFYLSLGMNGLHLNNYMLDFGASTNVMSLKVMEQLGLKTT
jgi:hypothetical protein